MANALHSDTFALGGIVLGGAGCIRPRLIPRLSLHPVMHHCRLACCTVMHLLATPPLFPPAVPCTMALVHLSVLPAALYRVLGSPPLCSSLPNNPPPKSPPSLPAVPIQWAIHFICRSGPGLYSSSLGRRV